MEKRWKKDDLCRALRSRSDLTMSEGVIVALGSSQRHGNLGFAKVRFYGYETYQLIWLKDLRASEEKEAEDIIFVKEEPGVRNPIVIPPSGAAMTLGNSSLNSTGASARSYSTSSMKSEEEEEEERKPTLMAVAETKKPESYEEARDVYRAFLEEEWAAAKKMKVEADEQFQKMEEERNFFAKGKADINNKWSTDGDAAAPNDKERSSSSSSSQSNDNATVVVTPPIVKEEPVD